MAIKDYSTYVPTALPDWAKLTNGLIDTVNTIGSERQAEKDSLDKMMTDANALMDKEELYSSQNLNEFVLSGADGARTLISQWNKDLKAGKLSPKEYRNRMNNINAGWSTLANSAKTFDAANNEFLKRQTPGEDGKLPAGSEFEQTLSQVHAELANLKNKKVFFDPLSGKSYTAKITDQGVDPSTMTPSVRFALPNNLLDNRIDLMSMVKSNFADYTLESGNATTSDPLQNPAVAKAIVSFQQGILSNDRYVSQVLAHYSPEDYDYYQTDEEKMSIVSSMAETDIKARKLSGKPDYTKEELDNLYSKLDKQLIRYAPDNTGVYQPIITDEQRKVADDIVLNLIKAQIPYKKLLDEPISRSGGGGGGGGGGNDKVKETPSTPGKAYDAWVNKDADLLSRLSGNKYKFKWVEGGLGVIEDEKKAPTKIFKSIYDMFDMFGYGSANQREDWKRLIKDKASNKPSIQSATNADWLKAGWKQSQINEAVKAGKIKVIK